MLGGEIDTEFLDMKTHFDSSLCLESARHPLILFLEAMLLNQGKENNKMKKKFRILAAALALCLSVLCSPAALAGGYGTAAATQPAAAVQTISTSQKTEQQVWIPTHGGKKYHSKSSCSGMKDPEKVSLSTAKQRGFTACKKCYR